MGKRKNDKLVALRMPSVLHDELVSHSIDAGKSLSEYVRAILAEYVVAVSEVAEFRAQREREGFGPSKH